MHQNKCFATGIRSVCAEDTTLAEVQAVYMASHLHLAPPPAPAPTSAPASSSAETESSELDAPTIRVLLADDHTFMRRSLRLLLDNEEGVEVVAEADDLDSVMDHLNGHEPHVLVLDLNLPGESSIATIAELRRQMPRTQIVVLTMHDNPAFAQRTRSAGALGFVLKDLADSELGIAVRAAAKGEAYLSPRIAGRLAIIHRSLTAERLSTRELEVLRLLALGHTSVEIASQLHLSPRTVESHRARIHRKLGLPTRAELVRYALGRGLLSSGADAPA